MRPAESRFQMQPKVQGHNPHKIMAVFRLMMHTGKFLERLVVGVFPAMLLGDAVDVVADVATSSALRACG